MCTNSKCTYEFRVDAQAVLGIWCSHLSHETYSSHIVDKRNVRLQHQWYKNLHTRTCIRTFVPTYLHTYRYTESNVHSCIHALNPLTYVRTRAHARTHARTHTYIHTYIHYGMRSFRLIKAPVNIYVYKTNLKNRNIYFECDIIFTNLSNKIFRDSYPTDSKPDL